MMYLCTPNVRWCNGSTADFDSACLGSNPSRTTVKMNCEGDLSPLFFYFMTDKNYILDLIDECLEDSDRFLVNLSISKDNKINVVIDSDTGVTIDNCVELSRFIEGNLDREKEDFELKVSSAGVDSPFKLNRQYVKNIGRSVKVVTLDNKVVKGILVNTSIDSIEIKQELDSKNKKSKKPVYGDTLTIPMSNIKETKGVITF